MNQLHTDTKRLKRVNHHPLAESAMFLVASGIGIYALGQGLTVLSAAGKQADLTWLVVAVSALVLLVAQMRRVHEDWPHRTDSRQQHALQKTECGPAPSSVARIKAALGTRR